MRCFGYEDLGVLTRSLLYLFGPKAKKDVATIVNAANHLTYNEIEVNILLVFW